MAVVRIDRPPANALDLELRAAGREAATELKAAEPGAVVIVGREKCLLSADHDGSYLTANTREPGARM